MISVIMKDGRVLRFNDAEDISDQNGFYSITDEKGAWFSKVNKDQIERIDYSKPCKVLKESRDKKKMKKY